MTSFTDHPAISWLGADPLTLPIYTECFDGAAVKIMGESAYLNAKRAGISLALTREHKVQTVFLYSEGVEGFTAYVRALPAGLTLASNRADVRAALGEAAMSAEPGGIGLMAIAFGFDRFEADDHYLHFEYLPGEGGIRLVTFGLCTD
jgi:hypothetical protein